MQICSNVEIDNLQPIPDATIVVSRPYAINKSSQKIETSTLHFSPNNNLDDNNPPNSNYPNPEA